MVSLSTSASKSTSSSTNTTQRLTIDVNDAIESYPIRKNDNNDTSNDNNNNECKESLSSHKVEVEVEEKSADEQKSQQQRQSQPQLQKKKKKIITINIPTETIMIACQFCQKQFASKNLVFRHLRDVSSGCGKTISNETTGQTLLPDAPSAIKKHQKQEIYQTLRRKQRSRKTAKTKQQNLFDPASSLWFGDLPLPYTRMGGQYKRLRAILKEYLPRDVPQPWIKKVVRKAYRKGGYKNKMDNCDDNNNYDDDNDNDNDNDNDDVNNNEHEQQQQQQSSSSTTCSTSTRGVYHGFAIIVFRDAEEAAHVKIAMNDITIQAKEALPLELSLINSVDFSTFVLKVNNAVAEKQRSNNNNNTMTSSSSSNNNVNNNNNKRDYPFTGTLVVVAAAATSGQDPPLLDQLRPLSIPELQERCQFMRNRLKLKQQRRDGEDDDDDDDDNVLGQVVVSSPPGTTTTTTIKLNDEENSSNCNDEDGMKKKKKSSLSEKNNNNNNNNKAILTEHDKMLTVAVSLYEAISDCPLRVRPEKRVKGRIIPESIRDNLLHLLKNVRWPAESHRKSLSSDQYLVLQTNASKKDRFYQNLRRGCQELMEWADPNYYYSAIAVTKNFIASPHIDDRDQSFQYAVSLGDFTEGGELCVEGRRRNDNNNNDDDDGNSNDFVNVVETRNRIAKVDGRNIHWVRSWNNGGDGDCDGDVDRYSLIFYDTTDKHQTDIITTGVDITFLNK